jgi:cell division protein FtsN
VAVVAPPAAAAKPPPGAPARPPSKAQVPAARKPGPGPMLQVGSYPSQARAADARDGLRRRVPSLAGYDLQIAPARVGGKPVYRLLVAGFADRPQAEAACSRLQRSGHDCFVRSEPARRAHK